MAGPGRPTEFTAKKAGVIIRAIKRGNTRACAAGLAGIGHTCLMSWLARGREGEAPYADFAAQVALADAWIEDKLVGVVVDHAALKKKDPKASLAWLGLRRRKHWHEKQEAEVKVTHEGPDFSTLTEGELDTYLALQAKTLTKKEPHE